MALTKQYLAQTWNELTFANNFLFVKIMESEPDLCRQLLEMLLHIKIDHLEKPETEYVLQEGLNTKSVRFDVYTQDDNRIFDLEIQTTKKCDLAKRARYYQSIIDMDNLARGESYMNLKDTYVIFLCLDDIFGRELPVYFFENSCTENPELKLGDGAYKVFFNASGCDKMQDEEEKSFFKFLGGGEASSDFTRRIENMVNRAKENEIWRHQFMTWQQTLDMERRLVRDETRAEALAEGREAGLDEGRKLGLAEGRSEGARAAALENAAKLLSLGVAAETVAEGCSLPLEQVLQMQKEQ